jgi:uncharacterized protein
MWWIYEITIYVFLIGIGAFLIDVLTSFREKKHRRILLAISIIFGASWLTIFYGSFIEPRLLVVREYTVNLETDSEEIMNALVISDFHLGPYKGEEWARRVVEKAKEFSPDIIFLPGDFVFVNSSKAESLSVLGELSAPLGVFAVTGNHEYQAGATDEVVAVLEAHGIEVLKNESIALEHNQQEFILAGISDIWFDGNMSRTVHGLESDQIVILLSHNPDAVLYTGANVVDLIVSGHTHGGQIRLPFIGSVPQIPNQLGRAYDRDVRAYGNQQIFVTSGVGESGSRARLFNPPEMAILTIEF